jgi:hypothetical protein
MKCPAAPARSGHLILPALPASASQASRAFSFSSAEVSTREATPRLQDEHIRRNGDDKLDREHDGDTARQLMTTRFDAPLNRFARNVNRSRPG